MLATIVSELVGLSGETIQSFVPKLKLPENLNLVNILKKVVFIFIFIPFLIIVLNMDAISVPTTHILEQFFNTIPKIIVTVLIVLIFVIGGEFVSGLVIDLLESLNLEGIITRMNLGSISSNGNLPKLIGNIVYLFIVLFGITTALEKLEFQKLTKVLDTLVGVSGNILFGLVILIMGNWIASTAHKAMAIDENNFFVASIVRMCILVIF